MATPAYLAARRPACRRGPRAERPARARQPGRRPPHPVRGDHLPGHPAAQARDGSGCRCARPSRAGPHGPAPPGARASSGCSPTSSPCWSPAGPSGPSASTTHARAAAVLAAAGVQVLHVSGRGKQVRLPHGTRSRGPRNPRTTPEPRYVVVPYVDRMDLAYAACDAVVCRAGAGTVCELSALGIPAAYVPLPVGNGEQRRNAEPLVAAGGGLLVDDADLSPAWVRTTMLPVLREPGRRAATWPTPPAPTACSTPPTVSPTSSSAPPPEHLVSPHPRRRAPGRRGPARPAAERTGPRRRGRRRRHECGGPAPAGRPGAGERLRRPRLGHPARRCGAGGARVHVGHDAAHVDGAALVVVSTAVREDNPEVAPPAPPAYPSSTAPSPWPGSCTATAWSPWPAPTARPPRRP